MNAQNAAISRIEDSGRKRSVKSAEPWQNASDTLRLTNWNEDQP